MKDGNEIMFSANSTDGSVTNTQSFHRGPPVITADQSVLYNASMSIINENMVFVVMRDFKTP